MNYQTITMTSKMGDRLAGRSLPTRENIMPEFNVILFLPAASEGMAFGDIL
jgi:hypothetical protein